MKKLFITLGSISCLLSSAIAENEANLPITELAAPTLTDAVKKNGAISTPLVIQDKETAKKYLKGDTLEQIQALDFKKKKVLLFYWAGSGQDKLSFSVAESYPEQVTFAYKRGFTRDLRQHRKIYILRKNVSYAPPK